MKIALLGYGKMGKLIEQIAIKNGHSIVVRASKNFCHWDDLSQADVAIDFSTADAVFDHLSHCIKRAVPIVIGTTGWEERLADLQKMIADRPIGCLYAPNFSIGVYLFSQIVAYAAALMQPWTDYDVSALELHHKTKLDSPSGTAKSLAYQIKEQMPRLADLNFASVRCGHMPGTHTIYFDSPVDTITITHQAHSRDGFAQGALLAAQWLKTRTGFFTLQDIIGPLKGE